MEITGIAASGGIAKGYAYIVEDPLAIDIDKVPEDIVLVINFSTPLYFELFLKSKAIVTAVGGITCHAASLARDLSIPCVTAISNVFEIVKNGSEITVDGNQGIVYV